MDIHAVKSVSVKAGDVIVVEVDLGMMPAQRAVSYIEKVKADIQPQFPTNKILVIPMHKMRINVINVTDAPDDQITDVEYKAVEQSRTV